MSSREFLEQYHDMTFPSEAAARAEAVKVNAMMGDGSVAARQWEGEWRIVLCKPDLMVS